VCIRVIHADDHPSARRGVAALLSDAADIRLLAQAEDGEQALRLIHAQNPEIAVLDLAMPRLSGIEVAREILRQRLETRVVLLTMYDDRGHIRDARRAGVSGYVIKDRSFEDLVRAIRRVAAGGTFLPAAMPGL
jgi:DNA-binding NarL/FixJ family response regulator